MTHRRTLAALTVALAWAVGCGRPGEPVYPTRGRIEAADGRPATGALVIFHAPAGEAFAATVGESGEYRLDGGRGGLPAGEYVVTLVWHPPRRSPLDRPTDRLRGRYADPTRSRLRATVSPVADNVIPPIRLQ